MNDLFGTYARFYDLDYAGMDADLPMIQQFALRCGEPILELACGTGRVLIPLAQKGYQVTGVDISPAMLERARLKVAAKGLEERVVLVDQDMRELELDGRFNLALIVSNSFLHLLTLADQLAALTRFRKHLSPDGLLLIDVFNPDLSHLLEARGQVILDKVLSDPQSGRRVMKFYTHTVDLGQQVIDVTLILDEVDNAGRVGRTLFPFSLRYVFRSELELLLRHAGFEVEAIYGSYDLDEFTGDSPKLIAVARRPD